MNNKNQNASYIIKIRGFFSPNLIPMLIDYIWHFNYDVTRLIK